MGDARISARWLLTLAAWAGLLSGLADSIRLFFETPYSVHHWWMGLLSGVLMFVGVTSLALIGSDLWMPTWRAACLALITTAAYFPIIGRDYLAVTWGYELGCFLLALGLGVQGARLMEAGAERCQLFMARWTGPMLACVMGVSGVALTTFWLGSPRARDAAVGHGPNVLLITMDTVRSENMSLYGYRRRTSPWLSELAASSVCFDNAFASAPWTLPSHASIFTGRQPSELCRQAIAPFSAAYPTLAQLLRAQGYRTAGFVSNNAFCGRWYGFGRGFDWYEDVPVSAQETLLSSTLAQGILQCLGRNRWVPRHFENVTVNGHRKTARQVNDAFLAWQALQPGAPFFAFLNYMEAHEPLNRAFAPRVVGHQAANAMRRLGNMQALQVASYDAAIMEMDYQIHRLLDDLRLRHILDNTVVVITSDHGEHLGDHDKAGHGDDLYVQALRVPLIISWPARIHEAVRITQPVSLRSLAATILELSGGRVDAVPGPSLAPLCLQSGPTAPLSALYSELVGDSRHTTARSILLGSLHYIRDYSSSTEELYDLAVDPNEARDRLHVPAYSRRLRECRDQLLNVLGALRREPGLEQVIDKWTVGFAFGEEDQSQQQQ